MMGQQFEVTAFISRKSRHPCGSNGDIGPCQGYPRDTLTKCIPESAILHQIILVVVALLAMNLAVREEIRLIANFECKQIRSRRRNYGLGFLDCRFDSAPTQVQPPDEFPARGFQE